MTSSADHEQPAVVRRRSTFLLRDAADINRLLVHLVKNWTLPDVDVRVDGLPARDSHRAQDRFVRLAGACNCLVGELLGAATLLVGCCVAWASTREWLNLGLAAIATLCVALIGKAMELAWTRVRLLLVLRDLRHRLAEALAGRSVETQVKVPAAMPYRHALNREDGDVLHQDRIPRLHSRSIADRPRILLRDVGDIYRLALHLVTHWRLPHMEIRIDVLPRLTAQRAQERLVRLSARYTYLLAAVLGVVSLLGGLASMVWQKNPDDIVLWTMHHDWSDALMRLIATLCAALLGCAGEILWVRLRLLWVLLGLRFRTRAAQRQAL